MTTTTRRRMTTTTTRRMLIGNVFPDDVGLMRGNFPRGSERFPFWLSSSSASSSNTIPRSNNCFLLPSLVRPSAPSKGGGRGVRSAAS